MRETEGHRERNRKRERYIESQSGRDRVKERISDRARGESKIL